MGGCPHTSPSIHQHVFHTSVPGKHFLQFPAEGSDENLKSKEPKIAKGEEKNPNPSPRLCFEFSPACEANSGGPKHLLYLLTDSLSTQSSTAQHHLCEIKRQGFKWKKNIWGESPLKLQIQFKVTCIKQSYQCFRQKSLNESCFLNHHLGCWESSGWGFNHSEQIPAKNTEKSMWHSHSCLSDAHFN